MRPSNAGLDVALSISAWPTDVDLVGAVRSWIPARLGTDKPVRGVAEYPACGGGGTIEFIKRARRDDPGHTATICLRIVKPSVSSPTGTLRVGTVNNRDCIMNSPLELAPVEKGTVAINQKADTASEYEDVHHLLLWMPDRHDRVKGCRTTGTCHHVNTEGCPDHVHHWYDQLFCAHASSGRYG